MRIGIDLGGTKIEGVAINAAGEIVTRHRVQTPQGDLHATVQAVASVVRAIDLKIGEAGTVGIGTPGSLSPATGLIKNANSVCLNGARLDRALEDAIGRPVRLANDANCFALSEAIDGAGAGLATVFGVILGTGVGGGVIINRQALQGCNAIAGEWGHNPLPWPRADEYPGPECYCGHSGCIETFLSGPAMEAAYARESGHHRSATDIAGAAADGDETSSKHLDLYIDRLSRSLATVINQLDPDVIVLGGGLSRMTALFDQVPQRWGRYVFSDQVDTLLRPATHGDASGVRGAAWLWPEC